MKWATAISLLICVVTISVPSLAKPIPNDWKYFSDGQVEGIAVHSFFLGNEITQLSNHRLQIWVKGLSVAEMSNAKATKDLIDRAAKKLVSGYRPPIGSLINLNRDKLVDVIALEEQANAANISPQIQMLLELDCNKKLVRTLSIVINANGKFGSGDEVGDWEHIPPESTDGYLSSLVCN